MSLPSVAQQALEVTPRWIHDLAGILTTVIWIKHGSSERSEFWRSGESHFLTQRIADVIEACDDLGMAVILQLFYFGQDTIFETEAEVHAAADAGVDFVCERGYRNVIIDVANEVMLGHFHHDILKPERIVELIHQVRDGAKVRHGIDLIVSTSEAALERRNQWTDEQIDRTFEACDLLLMHGGDNIETSRVGDASTLAIKADRFLHSSWYKERPRPVLTNESQGEEAFQAMLNRDVSFGLHSIYDIVLILVEIEEAPS